MGAIIWPQAGQATPRPCRGRSAINIGEVGELDGADLGAPRTIGVGRWQLGRLAHEGDQTTPGGDRTIPVLLFQVQRDLSLINITNIGNAYYWAFVDVTITAI